MKEFGFCIYIICASVLVTTIFWISRLNDDVTLATKCKEGDVIEIHDKTFICELKEVEVKTTYVIKRD